MNLRRINVFLNEIYSNGPNWDYITNKTNVYYIGKIWSVDILDLKDYGPERIRRYRYTFFVVDIISIFCWTVPSKKKLLKPWKLFWKLSYIFKKNQI